MNTREIESSSSEVKVYQTQHDWLYTQCLFCSSVLYVIVYQPTHMELCFWICLVVYCALIFREKCSFHLLLIPRTETWHQFLCPISAQNQRTWYCSINVLLLWECKLATYSPNSVCITEWLSRFIFDFCLQWNLSSSSSWTTRTTDPSTQPRMLLTLKWYL